jgi:3-hydroxybutyryl-CoA dehydrogenase
VTGDDRPPPSAPRSAVVIGAGTMGPGIALTFAMAGTTVSLFSRGQSTLDAARRRIDASLELLVRKGAAHPGEASRASERISATTDLDDLDVAVDMVVESIVEDAEPKRAILRAVDERAPEGTILSTDTSSIPLGELSEGLRRPERFMGYHWFNPAELVRLVEVIPTPQTDPALADRLVEWSFAIGKEPVRLSRDIEGFAANRLQYALIREAYLLVEQGVCSFEEVDRVVTAGLGPRWAAVGPFESMDLAGLDVHFAVTRRLFPLLSRRRGVPRSLTRTMRQGALGAKSGRGLRGSYDPATTNELVERRADALLALGVRTQNE